MPRELSTALAWAPRDAGVQRADVALHGSKGSRRGHNKEMANLDNLWPTCRSAPMESEDRTTTMNVSLPGSLRAFVEAQVSEEGYTSASEFVRELIRSAKQRLAAQEHLEELLLEGIKSGPATEWTDEDWRGFRQRVAKRLEAKKESR